MACGDVGDTRQVRALSSARTSVVCSPMPGTGRSAVRGAPANVTGPLRERSVEAPPSAGDRSVGAVGPVGMSTKPSLAASWGSATTSAGV